MVCHSKDSIKTLQTFASLLKSKRFPNLSSFYNLLSEFYGNGILTSRVLNIIPVLLREGGNREILLETDSCCRFVGYS